MEINKVPKAELNQRLLNFIEYMNRENKGFDAAFIFSRINQFYFTGTMQDGVLFISKDGDAKLFVRRNYQRAVLESLMENIYEIKSYNDVAQVIGSSFTNIFMDTEVLTLAAYTRFSKYIKCEKVLPLDFTLSAVRAVKSPYELERTFESGRLHEKFTSEIIPSFLKYNISEAELISNLYAAAVKLGHHGTARFAMNQNEMMGGQVAFSESALYPTNFDGPGGAYGMSPAVPFVGSRQRLLKKGDLVFVDFAFGFDGYHTDKTQVYSYKSPVKNDVLKVHEACVDFEGLLAKMLVPGALAGEIYEKAVSTLQEGFLENFMGFGKSAVKFFGHGVGLQIDEVPVIAKGFKMELKENMIIALEPKKAIVGAGLVGVENTFIVTKTGGRCITGEYRDIIEV